jgi:hypothetical protein
LREVGGKQAGIGGQFARVNALISKLFSENIFVIKRGKSPIFWFFAIFLSWVKKRFTFIFCDAGGRADLCTLGGHIE